MRRKPLFGVYVMPATNFGSLSIPLLMSLPMFVLASLMSLISQVSGTPYIPGGDSPAGTDCSGLASWVANAASDRPVFGSRFNTGNEEAALLARGFQYGTAPNAVVIGWNGGHTAVTLPDGTPVSSGERGGVHVGGSGAYQAGFTHHMFLPMPPDGGCSASPAGRTTAAGRRTASVAGRTASAPGRAARLGRCCGSSATASAGP